MLNPMNLMGQEAYNHFKNNINSNMHFGKQSYLKAIHKDKACAYPLLSSLPERKRKKPKQKKKRSIDWLLRQCFDFRSSSRLSLVIFPKVVLIIPPQRKKKVLSYFILNFYLLHWTFP